MAATPKLPTLLVGKGLARSASQPLKDCIVRSSQGSLKKSSRCLSESTSTGQLLKSKKSSLCHPKTVATRTDARKESTDSALKTYAGVSHHGCSSKQQANCEAPRKVSRASSEPQLVKRHDLVSEDSALHHASSWRVSRRKSRHESAIEAARQLHMSRSTMQHTWQSGRATRDVTLIRMVFSEARRRHQVRPSYQRRLAEQDRQKNEIVLPFKKELTIWRLRQLRDILREAVRDVYFAVKSCRGSNAFLHNVHEESVEHKAQKARDHLELQRCAQEREMRTKSAWRILTVGLAARHASDAKDAIKKAQSDCEHEWQYLYSTLGQ